MKQKRLLIVLTLLCLLTSISMAQSTYTCSFDEDRESWLGADSARHYLKSYYEKTIDQFRYGSFLQAPADALNQYQGQNQSSSLAFGTGCGRANFIIPVVFHVVYDPYDTITNISDAQVQNLLNELNNAFSGTNGGVNTGIQFCLAKKKPNNSSFSGINHIPDSTPNYRYNDWGQKAHLASLAYYDRTRYLNVWIVKDIRDSTNTTSLNKGGYSNISYQTGIDGVVLRYVLAGNYTNCSGCALDPQARGHALVHEIGHWFGLEHTFKGGCTGNDSLTCKTNGDRCCDTRPHQYTTTVCPNPDTITCTNANGYYGNQHDPTHNYMSYTSEACTYEFTADQTGMMWANLMLIRNQISTFANLAATNLSCCMVTTRFEGNKMFLCQPDSVVTLTGYSYSGVSHLWKIYRNDTLITTYSDTSNTFTCSLPALGKYDVAHALIYYNGSANDTTQFYRINGYIEYVNCGTNIANTQGNWYFGELAGIRFTNVGAIRDLGAINANPQTLSIVEDAPIALSNDHGDLLFYGYDKYWGKGHVEMGSSPISLSGTPTQGLVSFPVPFKHNLYFVARVSGVENMMPFSTSRGGISYSIIDTATSGVGDFVPGYLNNAIEAPDSGSELAIYGSDTTTIPLEFTGAIPKCNGENYWAVFVDGSGLEFGSCGTNFLCPFDTFANQLKILIYSVDSTGFTHHSVSDSTIYPNDMYATALKFSPDGQRLAIGRRIFSFDRRTGTIKYNLDLSIDASIGSFLGGSFSPNSQVYYLLGGDNTGYYIYQYDLNSLSASIPFKIRCSPVHNMMQLGPDDKLYISKEYGREISVINYPDSVCSLSMPNACGYEVDGPRVSNDNGLGPFSRQNLPNMVDAKKAEKIPLTIHHKDTACFTVKLSSTVCCASSFKWYFGDGDSSQLENPTHTYDTVGSYQVMLIADLDTIQYTLKIGIDQPIIGGSNTACDTLSLFNYSVANLNQYLNYNWTVTDGLGTPADFNHEIDIRWTNDTGVVKLVASNPKTGCIDSANKIIYVSPSVFNYNISANQSICPSTQPAILLGDTPTGGLGQFNYQWYKSTDTGLVKQWTLLTGDTLINYQPSVLNITTWYKRVVNPFTCPYTSNSIEVTVQQITNDTISKDSSDCDDILGSTPVSISGIQSYFWERSANGITWETISGETQKDLKYPVFFDTTYVRRIVTDSNACSSTSNVVIPAIFAGDITYSGDTLCTGNELNVSGNAPCSGHKTISYHWMYRKLGTSTYDYLGGSSGQNYTHSSWTDSCYLMREMTSFGKVSYSDSVLIPLRPLLINYLLDDGDTTCSARNLHPIYGSFSCASTKYFFRWQTTLDTNATWTDAGGAGGIAYDYNPPSASQTTYYRRRMIYDVNGTKDTTYSNTYTIYVMDPEITSQPQNTTVNDGASANFSISLNEMTLLRWEKRTGSSPSYIWVTVAPGTNPFNFVADKCMNGVVFRAVLLNHCTGDAEYSSEAVLTVNSVFYDLWSKDNDFDVGSETVNPTSGFIWNSPDIWNTKYYTTTSRFHQNPEYRVDSPNYVHTIIRNRQSIASVPAKVYLYWTFASTGEQWNRHWRYDTTQSATVGNWNLYNGAKKGKGDLIGIYNIPSISFNDSFRIDAPWFAPDPGITTGNSNTNQADICFLSRIVTCTDPDYGMYVPETIIIGDNVRKNNNIITKNFVIYDSLPGNGRISWGGNGNTNDGASATGVLRLRTANCDFFRYGYVLLHLDSTLQNIWTNTDGSGYTVVDDSTLMVDTCVEVVLENISYEAGQYGLLGVEFVMRNDYTTLSTFDAFYEFDLEEMLDEDTVSIGGIHYGVPMHIEPLPESGMSRRIPPDNKQAIAGKTIFHAYPNPFTDLLTINYHIPKEEQVNIVITNLLGQKVATIENNTFKQSGVHKVTFNSATLKEGIYFINFTAGSYTQTQKVVLIR